MHAIVVATFSLAIALSHPAAQVPRHVAEVPEVSYDEFLALSPDAREATLRQMNSGGRLVLMRTHVERWLAANRASLEASQIAVVQEAIDSMSPDRSRDPHDRAQMKQEADLVHRLTCAIGEQQVRAAFTFREDARPADRAWAWWSMLDSWAQWLVECVAR